MLKTTANKITVLRILLIPVFLLLCYTGHTNWAFVVYLLACVSDFADGYIARHYHQITDWGKFMDPLADKMLVFAAMCFFVECHTMPGWVVAVVLLREFAVSGLRLVAVEQGRVIAAAWSGKIKTASTMVALGLMLLFGGYRMVNIICWVVILITTVWSGAEYFMKNLDVFRNAD